MSIPVPSLSPAETSYIVSSLNHSSNPTRPDGRKLFASRPIEVSHSVFPHANGSAHLRTGTTEVVAGVRLEVVDTSGPQTKGSEGWRARVDVDVTPQAYPAISSQALSSLSTHLTSILASHFIPSLPPLVIIPEKKYFQPHLHLTVISASGNITSSLILAARAAFADLKVPKTKVISWTGETGGAEDGGVEIGKGDLTGIKAAISGAKSKGKGKMIAKGSEDWDLDLEDGDGLGFMEGREKLPVLVTLNLVPDSPNIFLDATAQEEAACPTRIHLFFIPTSNPEKPNIRGIRLDGPDSIDSSRVKGLLEKGQSVASELIKEIGSTIPSV